MRLSFLEAANGCKRKVFVNIDKACGTCSGSGAKAGTKADKCKVMVAWSAPDLCAHAWHCPRCAAASVAF